MKHFTTVGFLIDWGLSERRDFLVLADEGLIFIIESKL